MYLALRIRGRLEAYNRSMESNPIWTKAVKTKLCEIGRSRFGCRVYARTNEVDEAYRDGGEWLYDVTWLEYEKSRPRRIG